MNPTLAIKLASDLIVSAGVGAVVGNAIKASTPTSVKTIQKITITVGSLALSSMVGAQAANYVRNEIDATSQQVQAIKSLFAKKN